MKNTIGKLGSQTIIFSIGGILSSSIGFFLLPLYTRYLTPADYGGLELVNAFYSISNQVFMLGLGTAMYRSYFKAESDQERRVIISSTSSFLLVYTFLLTLPLYLFSDHLATLMFGENANHLWLKLLSVNLFVNSLMQLPMRMFRAEQRAGRYVTVDTIVFLVTLTLNIIFIVKFNLGVLGILESRLIATFLGMAISIKVIFKYLALSISFDEIKRQLRIGVPLVIANMSFFLINLSDRYFLKSFSGMDNLGVYSLAFKFGSIITFLVVTPFSLAWGPFLFSVYKKENAKNIYSSASKYYLITICAIFLGISVFSKEIIYFLAGDEFHEAYFYIPLIAGGLTIGGLRNFSAIGYHLKGRTDYLAIVNWIAAGFCVLVNYLFISSWSVMGASVSVIITRGFLIISRFVVSQRLYWINYDYSQLMIIVAFCLLIYFFSTYIVFSNIVLNVSAKLLLISCFPLLLFSFKIITVSNFRSVISSFKSS